MIQKDNLFNLFDKLNESDQKKAYEFMQSLARSNEGKLEHTQVSKLYGKKYFVVSD